MQKFNTVILYDIENLLKGYGFSPKLMQGLSLTKILREVEHRGEMGKVAIQRAYANWSDSRLGFMKNEILELGIEPIQVFGFLAGQNKNAADIQLAIDAIDLVHTRPAIEVFVIVSGDGGFASLAKKLHEYGKTVIGCAYRKATNKVFEAVSDHFVWVEDPDDDAREENTLLALPTGKLVVTDPRSQRIVRKIKPIDANKVSPEEVRIKLSEILRTILSDTEWKDGLRLGLSLSTFNETIRAVIKDFSPNKLGFLKFIEVLRFGCAGTELAVYSNLYAGSEVRVGLRKIPLKNYAIMDDLAMREMHSFESYRAILETGTPIFKLPIRSELMAVCLTIQEHPIQDASLGECLLELASQLKVDVPQQAIKSTIFSLLGAGSFERYPENTPLAEQRITLKKTFYNVDNLLNNLTDQMKNKISHALGAPVNIEVFENVLNYVEED